MALPSVLGWTKNASSGDPQLVLADRVTGASVASKPLGTPTETTHCVPTATKESSDDGLSEGFWADRTSTVARYRPFKPVTSQAAELSAAQSRSTETPPAGSSTLNLYSGVASAAQLAVAVMVRAVPVPVTPKLLAAHVPPRT
ncbi:MAG: hypothetical protein ABUL60_20830 [Myxococcales bacterium]